AIRRQTLRRAGLHGRIRARPARDLGRGGGGARWRRRPTRACGGPLLGSPVMGGIIWLASYPKSGNTWMRAFLHNLVTNAQKPVEPNYLDQFTIGNKGAG